MDEDVIATVIALDKAILLSSVEPLNCPCFFYCHFSTPYGVFLHDQKAAIKKTAQTLKVWTAK